VAARRVDVWLPSDYLSGDTVRYPVIYMHDGQNLFDPSTSFIGVDWGIDETMTRLIAENKIRPAIVVGIWNTGARRQEYVPEKPLMTMLSDEAREKWVKDYGVPVSDNYLKFVVSEVKSFIDKNYRTLPDRENTFVMGSSLGALISAYAVTEYPHIFKGAGCVSTHWPVGGGVMIRYLQEMLPQPGRHVFYFDYGTETLDAQYEPYQLEMDKVMQAAGYAAGSDWVTMKFQGAEHSERAWSKRVHIPIEFFLGQH
jgi:predicted alpha/beta superfamily hydrolase